MSSPGPAFSVLIGGSAGMGQGGFLQRRRGCEMSKGRRRPSGSRVRCPRKRRLHHLRGVRRVRAPARRLRRVLVRRLRRAPVRKLHGAPDHSPRVANRPPSRRSAKRPLRPHLRRAPARLLRPPSRLRRRRPGRMRRRRPGRPRRRGHHRARHPNRPSVLGRRHPCRLGRPPHRPRPCRRTPRPHGRRNFLLNSLHRCLRHRVNRQHSRSRLPQRAPLAVAVILRHGTRFRPADGSGPA